MKKILSIALVIVMMMTMSVTAFAAESSGSDSATENNYSSSITVNGTLTDMTGNDIMVFVSWGDMSFQYIKNDYDNYTGTYSSYWSEASEGNISVQNYSNVAVDCSFSFSSDVWDGTVNYVEASEWISYTTYKATWDSSISTYSLEAPTTEDITNSTMPCGNLDVKIDRAAPAIDSDCEIGTITILISAVSE